VKKVTVFVAYVSLFIQILVFEYNLC